MLFVVSLFVKLIRVASKRANGIVSPVVSLTLLVVLSCEGGVVYMGSAFSTIIYHEMSVMNEVVCLFYMR